MKNNICILLVMAAFCLGCRKLVEIDPPVTKLVSSTVFQSDGTATAALLGAYASAIQQEANPFSIALYTGLCSDELKTYANGISLQQIYTNRLEPVDAVTNAIWRNAYNIIYQTNAVIEGCTPTEKISKSVRDQLIGEAKFLRAFWYFYLVNLYGDVPLVLTTDYVNNASLSRTSKEKVYDHIINDLKDAKEKLKAYYVEGSDVHVTSSRVRANKSSAAALLARVYLFNKRFADAEAEATYVIENVDLYKIVPLDIVFKANSLETILQFMAPLPTSFNTQEGAGFILSSKPDLNGNKSTTISDALFKSFEKDDLRKKVWIGLITDNSVTPKVDYPFPYKYKVEFGNDIEEHSMVLRLSEQYLIRAEARIEMDKLAVGIADLDVLRERANLPLLASIEPDLSKEKLREAVLQERRVELFTEWGHRWLDLKRMNKVDDVLTLEALVKGGGWEDYKRYFPIPQKDIENNRHIAQNEGYTK